MDGDSYVQLEKYLTADDAPYAIEDFIVGGVNHRVFRNGPRTAQDVIRKASRSQQAVFVVEGAKRYTYGDIFRSAARLAITLDERFGVRKGTRVGIAIGNRYEAIVAFVAVLASGGVAVLMGDKRDAEDLVNCADTAGCNVILQVAPGIGRHGALHRVPVVAGYRAGAGLEFGSYEEIGGELSGKGGAAEFKCVEVGPLDEAIIAFTSGSTSQPKGVILDHMSVATGVMNMMLAGTLANAAAPTAKRRPVARRGRPFTLLLTSLAHVSGYMQILLQMRVGGGICLGGAWSSRTIAETIHAEKISSVIGLSPIQTADLLKFSTMCDLTSLSSLHVHGYALHQGIAGLVAQTLPATVVGTSYGMTETSGAICALAGDLLRSCPESVGRAVPTAEVRIVDENGRQCGHDEAGEIWVRGAMLFRAYCGVSEGSPSRGGWFRTGDIGRLSADRFLTIMGRTKNLMRGNGLLSNATVERLVSKVVGVGEAVAVTRRTAQSAELIIAVVPEGVAYVDKDEIIALVSDRLGVVPKVLVVPELRKNAAGKVEIDRFLKTLGNE